MRIIFTFLVSTVFFSSAAKSDEWREYQKFWPINLESISCHWGLDKGSLAWKTGNTDVSYRGFAKIEECELIRKLLLKNFSPGVDIVYKEKTESQCHRYPSNIGCIGDISFRTIVKTDWLGLDFRGSKKID